MHAPCSARTAAELLALMGEHVHGFWVPDLPDSVYHRPPGVSRSALMRLLKTPHHYRALMDPAPTVPRKEPSAAMDHGSLVHLLSLQSHLFDATYRVGPDVESRALKVWKEWAAENAGFTLITPTQYERARLHAQAIAQHPCMLATHGADRFPECSIYWPDPSTGVWLKARPDLLVLRRAPHGLSVEVIDLKTTGDASQSAFSYSVESYGYAHQKELYSWGVEEVFGVAPDRFLFLASESEFPFACAVYELGNEWREWATRDIARALDTLKRCGDADDWPSYPTEPVTLPATYRVRKALMA